MTRQSDVSLPPAYYYSGYYLLARLMQMPGMFTFASGHCFFLRLPVSHFVMPAHHDNLMGLCQQLATSSAS